MIHKLTVSLVAAMALIMMMGTVALAADAPVTAPYGSGQCANFVDADGDGVCDNLGQSTPPRDGTGSQNGNAQRQQGAAMGNQNQGANGVCSTGGQPTPPRDGTGSQNGNAQRGGRGGRP